MDQSQAEILRENRVNIVQDLEPKGTVLDSLYEDGILTENDVELVSSAKTRKERVQALLSILPTRGPVAYGSFQKALKEGQYEDLVQLLAPVKHTTVQLDDMKFTSGSCQPCLRFLERLEASKKKKHNITLKKLLRWQCCLFLDNIEPKDIIDQLFQDHVITIDDIDKISSRATRRERCEKCFQILLGNTNISVTNTLQRALLKKYSYIAEEFSKIGLRADMTSIPRDQISNTGRRGDRNITVTGETRPKVLDEYSSDENECLREIQERTASTFGNNLELVTKTPEETEDKIVETLFRGELEPATVPTSDSNIKHDRQIDIESLNTGAVDEDLNVARHIAESTLSLGDTSILLTRNTRPKMDLNENEEGECRRELETRNSSALGETWATMDSRDRNTRQNLIAKQKLADNPTPRDIEERTASTFCTTFTDETNPKEVIDKDSDACEKLREFDERGFNALDEHSESDKKYYEYTQRKEVVGEKTIGLGRAREVEEISADSFKISETSKTLISNCETQPKELINGKENVDQFMRDTKDQTVNKFVTAADVTHCKELVAGGREIEERFASSFDSMMKNNSTGETYGKMKFFDASKTPNTRPSVLTDNKCPLSGDTGTCHSFDCVDSAISEKRLKVITLDNSLKPMKSDSAEQSDNNNEDSKSCLTCTSLVRNNVPVSENTQNSRDKLENAGKHHGKELLPLSVTATHTEKPRKRLSVAFNYLSTLINQGEFTKFQDVSSRLRKQFPTNYDLMCILGYLQASRDLFQTDFDSAKKNIDATMALVPKSSNPRYFTLELFTAKTRMYITRKKLEKLQTTLDEAMMILETDPVGCTGRAAGWLYINHARNQTAQLTCLNLTKQSALSTYERLFLSAKSSFQRSMSNFKRDGGKDGPFGFGYALCRLVILLLRCGDNGLTMDMLTSSADDIRSSGQYLQHLEDSDIVIPKILDMHFRIAKCDYQFRRQNYIRAFEHAQIAYDLATEMNLLEFKEHAHNRLANLKSKTSAITSANEMTAEEIEGILFCESTDTDYN